MDGCEVQSKVNTRRATESQVERKGGEIQSTLWEIIIGRE